MKTFVCVASALLLGALVGCSRHSSTDVSPASSTSAAASSAAPALSGSAVPSDSGKPPGTAGLHFDGAYTAKKVSIELPEKVKDYTWKKDPGDKNLGAGKLSIGVFDTVVRGQGSGALGDQILSGIYDGKVLRLSLSPKHPGEGVALAGTGYGEVNAAGAIAGTVRCSGPDGVVVREATFELKPE